MPQIGKAEGRIAGNSSQRQEIARVVHAASKGVFLGPPVESGSEFIVTSPCQGNLEHITVTGVVCGFDELKAVPGIKNTRRRPNCPRT